MNEDEDEDNNGLDDEDDDEEGGKRKKYLALGKMMLEAEEVMNKSAEMFHPERNNSDENEIQDSLANMDLDDLEKQLLGLEDLDEGDFVEGKMSCLNRLKREIRWPYASPAIRSFEEMHRIARFNRMTGETLGVTIGAGQNITGKITRILRPRLDQQQEQQRMGMRPLVPSRAFVSLRAGMRGVLFRTNVQDFSTPSFDMSTVVQENRRYVFRIVGVKETQWGGEQFELSMLKSDVDADPRKHLSSNDMGSLDAGLPSWMRSVVTKQLPPLGFFRPNATKNVDKKEKVYVKRNIMHDEFKNLNGRKAEDYLRDKDDGEIVFRPSRKGIKHLTVTIKLKEETFLHVDIEDVSDNTMSSNGEKKLKVGESEYRSLDMIQGQVCAPIATFARCMFEYNKFVEGGRDAVEQELQNLLNENPKRRHYRFTYDNSTPGVFILAYFKNSKSVKYIPLKLTQKGYQFYGTFLRTPKAVENHFKKNAANLAEMQLEFRRKEQHKKAHKMRQEQFHRMSQMNQQFLPSHHQGMMPPSHGMNYQQQQQQQQIPPGMPPGMGGYPPRQHQQFPPRGMPPGMGGFPPSQQLPPGMPPGMGNNNQHQFPPGMPPGMVGGGNQQRLPPGMPPGYRM